VCLEESITHPHSEPKKNGSLIPKIILQNIFQYYHSIMAMTSKKLLIFKIAIHISKAMWHPHYNTKHEKVKCNFTISFWEKKLPKKH